MHNNDLTASNQTAGISNVPFRFGCTDTGEFGYILNEGGADTVHPFKSGGARVIKLARITPIVSGSGYNSQSTISNNTVSINVTDFGVDKTSVDASNFLLVATGDNTRATTVNRSSTCAGRATWSIYPLTYDSSTGVVTASAIGIYVECVDMNASTNPNGRSACITDLYLVIGEIENA